MIFVHLFHFLRGYVIITVQGFFLERFINICTRRNLYLWDFKKRSATMLEVKISIAGFFRLREVARKSRCGVRIKAKRGLPFLLARYKRRYAILVGIVLFLGLFYGMTSFIWVIEFTGNTTIPADELMQNLAQYGIRYGTVSSSINKIELQNNLRTANDKIAWAGVEVSGSKLMIQIQERVIPPQIYDKNAPSNIVAGQDGVIDKMIVRYGDAVVKVGDTVKKGQLLVSGVLEGEHTGPRYINSDATIMAKTWYESRSEIPLWQDVKDVTGKTMRRHFLKIFNFRINFYLNGSIPYENYDTIENKKEVVLLQKTLPITFVTEQYEEYAIRQEQMEQESLAASYADDFENQIKSQGKQEFSVLNRIVEHEILDGTVVKVRVLLECSEDIAKKEPMNG